VLLAFWSPKGGSGTSVVASASALLLARHLGGVRLADLAGDQPAILGLPTDPEPGLLDWLAAGPEAPADAMERLAVPAVPGVSLLPRGDGRSPLAPVAVAVAEAGAALAVLLRDGPVPTIVDAGSAAAPAARAVVEVADASVVVLRGCYLALRRAVQSPLLARAAGVVLVEEQSRSLGPSEVRDVLDRPVLARIPIRANIARAVDAGVLPARLPDALARPLTRVLSRVGLPVERRGERGEAA
jgi:hypothetical protein